jgi:DNA invertase Pin-like site-specific DNA recombinase
MKVAIYARVSTVNKKEPEKGQDPNLQLLPLREYCIARKLEIAGEYVDKGISGVKDRRPELDRLMEAARKRLIDCIIVWKLDRFGRSLKHLVTAIEELNNLGVAFVSYRENIDLSTPSGRLMFQMIAAMAEFERELIRERVVAGLVNARAKGKKIGRKGLAPMEIKKVIKIYTEDPSRSVRTVAKLAKASPASAGRIMADYKAGKLDVEGLRQ